MNLNVIESINTTKGTPFMTRVTLSKQLGVSPGTVDNRAREIKKEVENGRYPDNSVIEDGGLKLLNYLVFIDYINNRQKLLEPNLRKYVEPFDARKVAESIGWYN